MSPVRSSRPAGLPAFGRPRHHRPLGLVAPRRPAGDRGSPTLSELLENRDEEAIESQEPFWEPGTRHGYHGFTYGTLTNGVFRRALGMTVGAYVRERIAAPLCLDLWIGTPESALERVVTLEVPEQWITPGRVAHSQTIRFPRTGPSSLSVEIYNRSDVLRGEWPATSGVADARSLARLLDATLRGEILSVTARDEMIVSRSQGPDYVLESRSSSHSEDLVSALCVVA